MTVRNLLAALFALALVFGVGPSTATAVSVLDFTGGVVVFNDGSGGTDAILVGWSFVVTSPVTIAALGLFDAGDDGFATTHEVAVVDTSLSPVASTLVSTATSVPVPSTSSLGVWRFTPITPVTLDPGSYLIGASFVAGDPDGAVAEATASTIPGVVYGEPFVFPIPTGPVIPVAEAADGFFGPSMFAVTAVPEPSSLVLLGAGLAALGGIARLARRRV